MYIHCIYIIRMIYYVSINLMYWTGGFLSHRVPMWMWFPSPMIYYYSRSSLPYINIIIYFKYNILLNTYQSQTAQNYYYKKTTGLMFYFQLCLLGLYKNWSHIYSFIISHARCVQIKIKTHVKTNLTYHQASNVLWG